MRKMTISFLWIFYFFALQTNLFVQIQGSEICTYQNGSISTATITCNDVCCSQVASSAQSACCSSFSWTYVAISFFIVVGVCVISICLLYCRPLWKPCLCGYKCPCGHRSRVGTPTTRTTNTATHDNSVFVINNDGLPDYEMTTKDSTGKDVTPPSYNFVAEHATDFGIQTRVPSAPPQYQSRRSSVVSAHRPVSANEFS